MMSWFKRPARPRRLPTPRFRPAVESLEDRRLLAGNVLQTNLVSDLPGVAQNLDPNLVNPWGISESSSSFFWISDNGAGVSTLYNGQGQPQPAGNNPPHTPLIVSIPAPGDPLGASGTPTGTVFNIDGGPTGGFQLSGVDKDGNPTSASAVFLFATEDGTIVGWNPGVNPTGFDPAKAGTYGIIPPPADNSASEAIYKGLAIATGPNGAIFSNDSNSGTVLYAANFHAGTIDVFDTTFTPVTLPAGAFTDPNLPAGYAPFNIQVLNVGGTDKVYVTYAKQDADKEDDVTGHGFGFVDVYNLDGTGEQRLVSRGDLNAPWGLALAPSSFGPLAGALLVGNFGDGRIHAYNATTGAPMGTLKDPDGEPIQIDGLWALKVGNGKAGGDDQTVYFTAGLDDENHGLFGSLAPVAPGTPEGPAEQQMVQAKLDVVQLALTAVINDIQNGEPQATIQQDLQTLKTAVHDLVRAEIRFFHDTHTIYRGSTDQGGATLQSIEALFDQLDQLLDHGHGHGLEALFNRHDHGHGHGHDDH
jgi:uncharacterized protein (TIGR03118 family)